MIAGVYTVTDTATLNWNPPIVIPGMQVPITTSTNNNLWTPTTVNSSFQATASGFARWSGFGFKYTFAPLVALLVADPNPTTVTDPNGNTVSAWTYAQANLAGQNGMAAKDEKAGCVALDSAKGETQIKTGAAEAILWVGTDALVDPAWTESDNNIKVTFYND